MKNGPCVKRGGATEKNKAIFQLPFFVVLHNAELLTDLKYVKSTKGPSLRFSKNGLIRGVGGYV